MDAGFREIEHTADRSVQVWAESPAGLFEQAARAMFTLMIDIDTVPPARRRSVSLEAGDLETALIDWLNELIYQRETRGEMYSEFGVALADGRLSGWFAGSPGSPTHAVVKAATFHDLHVERDNAGVWRATIVFDT